VGTVFVDAVYKEIMFDGDKIGGLLRVPSPSLPPPSISFQPIPQRPAPEDRCRRVQEAKAETETRRKRKRAEVQVDTGEELVGKELYDDDLGLCTVTEWGTHNGEQVVWYKHSRADSSGCMVQTSPVTIIFQGSPSVTQSDFISKYFRFR
jgi:hypothetical protein